MVKRRTRKVQRIPRERGVRSSSVLTGAEGLARAIVLVDAEAALGWAEQVNPAQRSSNLLDEAILKTMRADAVPEEEKAPSPLGREDLIPGPDATGQQH